MKTEGPTALGIKGQELAGHSGDYHAGGYSSPIGRLKDCDIPLENSSPAVLARLGLIVGKQAFLRFENGVNVSGKVEHLRYAENKLLLVTFSGCTVKYKYQETIFLPEWGDF